MCIDETVDPYFCFVNIAVDIGCVFLPLDGSKMTESLGCSTPSIGRVHEFLFGYRCRALIFIKCLTRISFSTVIRPPEAPLRQQACFVIFRKFLPLGGCTEETAAP